MLNQKTSGLLVTVLFMISIFLLQACVPSAVTTTSTPTATMTATADISIAADASPSASLRTFNSEELAKYNGKNGNPTYVAVNGIVYDVTNVPEWQGGIHQGRIQAGRDLSEEIKKSPHGVSKLETVPIVGAYIN